MKDPRLKLEVVALRHALSSTYFVFRGKSIYRLSTDWGVIMLLTLPEMTPVELAYLYNRDLTAFSGRSIGRPEENYRAREQAIVLMAVASVLGVGFSGSTIVEAGSREGHLLFNLRALAGQNGHLIGYEADMKYVHESASLLDEAVQYVPGLAATIWSIPFDLSTIPGESVDFHVSSHFVEHLPNPCTWLAEIWRTLKPGGLVLTEVPDELAAAWLSDDKVPEGMRDGSFHLLGFSKYGLSQMMLSAGFESMSVVHTGPHYQPSIQSVFRKPTGSSLQPWQQEAVIELTKWFQGKGSRLTDQAMEDGSNQLFGLQWGQHHFERPAQEAPE